MIRSYYNSKIKLFLNEDNYSILGKLIAAHPFQLDELQRNAWISEIDIFKTELKEFKNGYISFEYTIPRIGKRVDAILIINNLVFVVECKIGETQYKHNAINQVIDYALDLNDFHEESKNTILIPILLASETKSYEINKSFLKSKIANVQKCNKNYLHLIIENSINYFKNNFLSASQWLNSRYKPTPTIIEAAQILYRTHTVENISRNDASAYNLSKTNFEINKVIDYSKNNNKKSICFVTGVPGAGKTLAGLNIAIDRQRIAEDEHAVFLSGNGPLVGVLQEALARDQMGRDNIKKIDAKRKAKEFMQLIHHFRDDAILSNEPPIEKVVIFDEAQRAWTKNMLENFMKQKKGRLNFSISEPEFLISIMDRHKDWAVIICLIGGGQEINTGEAGLQEWFRAVKTSFPYWHVYISNQISDSEYSNNITFDSLLDGMNYTILENLHLAVSLRSYRSENISRLVKSILDCDIENSKKLYTQATKNYPIAITRDFNTAKQWIFDHAKGTQRYGKIASSGAKRLKKFGIWVQCKIDPIAWFLNDEHDVRSSYYLEDTATEFDIQGLELDWAIVCWDANLRITREGLEFYSFKGSRWQNINNSLEREYLKNSYRVLLTRARQGFIIFIPYGEESDLTRKKIFYDTTYEYFKEIGIQEI